MKGVTYQSFDMTPPGNVHLMPVVCVPIHCFGQTNNTYTMEVAACAAILCFVVSVCVCVHISTYERSILSCNQRFLFLFSF
jgi:hypothetical protein